MVKMKLFLSVILGVFLCTTVFAGLAFAADFIPAAEIEPPPGVSLYVLPVDQVAEKPLRIATIMVQNNPFGMAVMKGTLFAKEILKDRNCRVDWISVPDFDPKKFEDAMQNVITAQYDAVTLFGLSEMLETGYNLRTLWLRSSS